MRRLALFAVPLFAACVTTPPPTDELAAARAMVGQAQPLAAREAPAELGIAQAKLAHAEDAMQRGDYDDARRLSEQAEVDAKLALALAENARAQRGAAEVEQSIEALRAELRKEQQP
jgi:hypothetical protein